ncbi:MAG: YggT family protein [Aeromonadaceae bacterium]
MQTLYFLLDTLFNLYLMVVILRIWLQWVRADFYNPLSQFSVKATHPLLAPLRRVIPSLGGLDLAAVVLALVVALLKYATLKLLGMIQADWLGLLMVSALLVLKQAGSLLFWMLVARALLSWVSQGRSPVDYVLFQLTEPLLAPIRRIIPAMGGLDFSVLVLFIGLQALNYLLSDLIGPLWSML